MRSNISLQPKILIKSSIIISNILFRKIRNRWIYLILHGLWKYYIKSLINTTIIIISFVILGVGPLVAKRYLISWQAARTNQRAATVSPTNHTAPLYRPTISISRLHTTDNWYTFFDNKFGYSSYFPLTNIDPLSPFPSYILETTCTLALITNSGIHHISK